ncbi:MAG: hypothetical protein AB2L11_06150 [Syntrophobacteraceae bacterium]
MLTMVEMLAGLILGFVGVLHVLDNPVLGSCALFVSGLLFLKGIDGSSSKEVAGELQGMEDEEQ